MISLGILHYAELVDKEKVQPIIGPGMIPVHPSVYRSDAVFTQEFYDGIRRQLHASIDEDLSVIEGVLGESRERLLGDYNLANVGDPRFIEQFHGRANSSEKSVDFGFSGANIALHPGSYCERLARAPYDFSSSLAGRLFEFSLTPERLTVPVWYTHGAGHAGMAVYLYLRNFAILFNNLGVEKAGNS